MFWLQGVQYSNQRVVQIFLDDSTNSPFYGSARNKFFYDSPYRVPNTGFDGLLKGNNSWIGRLYLAERTSQTNVNNKPIVNIYEGIEWGWQATWIENPCNVCSNNTRFDSALNPSQSIAFSPSEQLSNSVSTPDSSTNLGIILLGILGIFRIFKSNKDKFERISEKSEMIPNTPSIK